MGTVPNSPNVWDAKTGKLLVTLKKESLEYITDAAFSPDGLKVATFSADKTACLWDATTAKPQVIFKGHEAKVVCAAFSPDGERLVTASDDKTGRIWDSSFGPDADARKGIWSGFNSATVSPDGQLLLATYNHGNQNKGNAVVWDTKTGRERVRLQHARANMGLASFSSDGNKVITGSSDNHIHVWDTVTGKELAVLGPEKDVRTSAFSEDGLFAVTTDGSGHVWDAVTGKKLALLKGDEVHPINSARFSPDGKHVVTISTGPGISFSGGGLVAGGNGPGGPWTYNDRVIACIWDATTGTKLIWLKNVSSPLGGSVSSAIFCFDGKWLLTAMGPSAQLWDLSAASSEFSWPPKEMAVPFKKGAVPIVTAKREIASPQLVLKGHEGAVYVANMSPGGSRVVTASEDRTVRIWDAKTGAVLAVLKGHQEGVQFACFSPDAKTVLTGGGDNTVRLWNSLTGKEVVTIPTGNPLRRSAGFSADGQHAFVVCFGEARVWPVDLLAAAKQRKPRHLTQAERDRFELEVSAKR